MNSSYQPITKVLIVNRSEIASRIVAAAWSLGIKPVVIYTVDEVQAPYVYEAYEAYPLSNEGAKSYLDINELLAIARQAKVDAIHPGYGFLSENADFAQAVIDNGFCWVGPSPAIIRRMGNKQIARAIAVQSGIPVIPGIKASIDESVENILQQVVQEIGFPVLIKDPLSGGGKGTTIANTEQDFYATWDTVRKYVNRTTHSSTLILERYLPTTRHIEVQIAGDGRDAIHLFERDCTTQRRYQKIIEEAPSSFVAESSLQKMYDAAIMLAQHVGYDSVGTVEFLVDGNGESFFLEINTRLQVEHAVTEQITTIDLVALQFVLAATKKLPYTQEQIVKQGYAIQCRLYAENPHKQFLPSTGTVTTFSLPQAPFVRVEHALYKGKVVSHHFDPMLAKIITYGKTRDEALAKMRYALQQLFIDGLTTNQKFLLQILTSELFLRGAFDVKTFSQEKVIQELSQNFLHDDELCLFEEAALVAMFLAGGELTEQERDSGEDNWKRVLWKQRNFI